MTFWRKLSYIWKRRAHERELEAEIESVAEIAAREAIDRGADPREAACAARRELGNLTLAMEDARAVWGWSWLDKLCADVRYTLRILRRQPGFMAVAILSLGLGIGANAALFSLVDVLLLRQLPVRDPEQVVEVRGPFPWGSYFLYTRIAHDATDVFTGMLATTRADREVDPGAGASRASVELVSGNYFDVLGVGAELGRVLTVEDDRRAEPSTAAVLGHGYWQRQFGGAPWVLGRVIRIQGLPFTVIGVAAKEFFGLEVGRATDVWAPIATHPMVLPGRDYLDDREASFLSAFARLRPGVSPQRAATTLTPLYVQLELERVGQASERFLERIRKQRIEIEPAAKGVSSLRRRFSEPLRAAFAMVGVVLLLACVNLMSLQFARAGERRRELGIRLAIGAGRLRIVRQLFTESLLVALAGAGLGLLLCRPTARALLSLASQGGQPVALDLRLNTAVVGFTLAVSVAAAIIFGVLPAWYATRGELLPSLQQSSTRTVHSPGRRLLGHGLASLQIGLSLFLVAAACLFSVSLYKLTHMDAGLKRRGLVMVDVNPADAGYRDRARINALWLRLLDRFASVPGVEAATLSGMGVYTGTAFGRGGLEVEGFQAVDSRDRSAWYDVVGPHHFTVVGTRLLAGRDFTLRDDAAAPSVAIVNEEFARFYFAGRNPLGRTVSWGLGEQRRSCHVIGVVQSVSRQPREKPHRTFYLPILQEEFTPLGARFLVRTHGNPAPMYSALRQAVKDEDPALPTPAVDSADSLLSRTIDRDRLLAALSAGFGVLALVIAAIGIYGLLCYEVTARTGEVGIRMALGATGAGILGMILREVAVIAAAGLVVGGAAALASARLVTSLVFELRPNNPAVLAVAACILLAVALAAGLLPARRAARLDPMAALRHE